MLSKIHVIALSNSVNTYTELEIYAYSEYKIYLYSPQWDLGVSWDYNSKIKELALDADKGLVEWVDLYIEDGQEITVKDSRIYIDGIEAEPFSRLSSENFANIGPITTKIYNELLCSREKQDIEVRNLLKETFNEGLFSKHVADIVEFYYQHAIQYDEFNNLDKQIIVRTKIEGYMFIINFIKTLLKSKIPEKNEYCEMFLSRVFLLESQNFINGNIK